MNNLILPERGRRHLLRAIRKFNFENVKRRGNIFAFTFKGIFKWTTVGLDLSDSGFSKFYSTESKFEKEKKKYDLSPEIFKTYTDHLIEKVERIHAFVECNARVTTLIQVVVLKEYSSIIEDSMIVKKNNLWPIQTPNTITDQSGSNKFTASQIKSSVLGSYIHDRLNEDAKQQLEAESNYSKVKDLK